MGFVHNVKQAMYRLKLRQALQKASIEELHINNEELKKEFDRRRKVNGKKRIN